jgi:hypothetical protein
MATGRNCLRASVDLAEDARWERFPAVGPAKVGDVPRRTERRLAKTELRLGKTVSRPAKTAGRPGRTDDGEAKDATVLSKVAARLGRTGDGEAFPAAVLHRTARRLGTS